MVDKILNRASEIFRKMREGKYIVTPYKYKEECGVVSITGGDLIDKKTGDIVKNGNE